MEITNDQYQAMSQLEKWYRKYTRQFIEVSGVVGTGVWDLIQSFIDTINLDPREVMYLSYDQKQVLELAARRFHAYYINSRIYKYTKIVYFDSLPVLNPSSSQVQYQWKKSVRKKVDERYKLIVVFDSVLLNDRTVCDLASLGLPVILIRDPMLLPAPDSYTFLRDPNVQLREIHPALGRNPITYFAHRVLLGEKIPIGNYDTVSVVSKKQMNLYNLKSSDMNIALSDELRMNINHLYRERILKLEDDINIPGEKLIVMQDCYNEKLVNKDEKHIKIYLTRGLVGTVSRINKHALSTRYVPIDFKPEFYHEAFAELYLDRFYLNRVQDQSSRQTIPDEIFYADYAYALTPHLARLSHWDKITLMLDNLNDMDEELFVRMMYTSITRARKSLTIVL